VTRTESRTLMAVAGACVTLVISACGSSVTPGQPPPEVPTPTLTSSTPSAPGPRTVANISPCEDLTAANVAGLGFDPATKRKADLQGQNVSERGCRWSGRDVSADLLATNATVAMYQARTDLANVRLLTVAGLSSHSSQIPNDPGACRVVSDISGGGLVVQLSIKGEHEAAVGVDSCTAAVRVMEQVAPILLKAK